MESKLVVFFLALTGLLHAQEVPQIESYCCTVKPDSTSLCVWYHSLNNLSGDEEKARIARSAYDSSLVFIKQARYVESILYNDLASQIWMELDSLEQRGFCEAYIGRAHYKLGNMYDAFRATNNALSLAESGNFLELKSIAHRFLSWNYWRVQQCDEALYHIEEYKRAIDEGILPSSQLGIYFNSVAHFENCKGNVERAIAYSDSTYAHALKNNDLRLLSLALSNKIHYIINTGSIKEQLELANEALRLNLEANDMEQYASNLGLLGGIFCRANEFDKAIEPGWESLRIATEMKDKPRMRVANVLLRRAYAGIGNFEKALEHELNADDLFHQIYGLKNLDRIFALEKEKTRVLQDLEMQKIARDTEINELELKQEKRVYIIVALASILLLIVALWSWNKYRLGKENETWLMREMYEGEVKKHELRSLRALMNPHFIFNSLNSIKSYIINKESRMATDYLNKFAELIRLILHNSQMEQITLEEELDTLDLYIQIESLRLEGQFDYNINCDPEISKGHVMIAPLIIQPFVENAIWHGLVNKTGHKSLEITVKKNANGVNVHILDNGIGRANAKLLGNNPLKHKSYGIEITENRINFLSSKNPRKNTLSINDLADEDGNASGTEVIISINT